MKKIFKQLFLFVLVTAAAASLAGCRISPALIDTIYTADAEEVDPNPTAREFTDQGEEDIDAPQNREEDEAEETNAEIDLAQAEQEDEAEDSASYESTDDSRTERDASEENTEDNNAEDSADVSAQTGDGDAAGASDDDSGDDGGSTEGDSEETGSAAGGSDSSGSGTDGDRVSDSYDPDSAQIDADETDNSNNVADPDDPEEDPDDTDNTNNLEDPDDTENTDDNDDTESSGSAANADEAPVKDVAKKVVTDGSGTEQEIPEDVFTVTAVGGAAPIVAMVGGAGRLAGTSESFAENEFGSMLLAASSNDEVNVWWSGDGSSGISDEDFTELLYASPDVCFEISGEATFTSEQVEQLEAHGIGYLVLPELSSIDNLKDAVTIIANALETNEDSGKSATSIAASYRDWVDECLSDASSMKNSLPYFSLYISEWRDDVTYTRYYSPGTMYEGTDSSRHEYCIVDFPESSGVVDGTGSGVAVAPVNTDEMPLWDFWRAAGIYNRATDGYSTVLNKYVVTWSSTDHDSRYLFPYSVWFGYPVYSDDSIGYFKPPNTSYLILHPDIIGPGGFTFWNSVTGQNGRYALKPENYLGGSDRFSAIVVADEETKEAISSSSQWKAGFLDDTYVAEDNLCVGNYAIDIAGDYDIYVNPSGFDNWAEGSVDSPLEVYWILWRISGGVSESRVITEVESFYSTFFGITLSGEQVSDMINQ